MNDPGTYTHALEFVLLYSFLEYQDSIRKATLPEVNKNVAFSATESQDCREFWWFEMLASETPRSTSGRH